MIDKRNLLAASFAFVAGVLLIVSGEHGPTGTYALILEKLDRNPEARRTWQVAGDLYNEADNTIKAAECNARAKRLA